MKIILKKLLALLFTSIFVFVLFPPVVFADGMIMPPPNRWVYQSEQQAAIYYENGTEVLVLSIKFQGSADDFGWIIPVPSRPSVEKAREDLFINLKKLTGPTYRPMPGIMYSMGLDYKAAESEVVVWETKKIDIYEISVLSSTSSGALQDWLEDNGYYYPKSYGYLLRGYISDYWFFVAVKVDTSVEPSLANRRLKSGHAAPLKLTFKTSQPIYPMKISAVTYAPTPTPAPTPTLAPTPTPTVTPLITPTPTPTPSKSRIPLQVDLEETNSGSTTATKTIIDSYPYPGSYRNLAVTLYVFDRRKVKASGYSTQYAGWVLPDTVKELSVDRNGDPWVEPKNKMYLTKLYRNYQISEINDDVVLLSAGNNKVVGAGERWVMQPWKAWLLVLSPLIVELSILGSIAFLEIRKLRSSEVVRENVDMESEKDDKII